MGIETRGEPAREPEEFDPKKLKMREISNQIEGMDDAHAVACAKRVLEVFEKSVMPVSVEEAKPHAGEGFTPEALAEGRYKEPYQRALEEAEGGKHDQRLLWGVLFQMQDTLDRAIENMSYNPEIEKRPDSDKRDALNMATIGLARFIDKESTSQAQSQLDLDQE